MNTKYKWLFFDADGTLLDYEEAEKYSLSETFQSFELSFSSEYLTKYRKINSSIWKDLEDGNITSSELRVKRFETLLSIIASDIDPAEFSLRYLHFLGQTGFTVEGSFDLLERLTGKVDMAIITNGIKDTQIARIEKSQIQKYFSEIIISKEAGYSKPNKEFFEYTMKKIDFYRKNEMLIIGDSLSSDIQGGINSGIDTCWFNPNGMPNSTPVTPKYEIQKLAQIESLLFN